MSKSKIAATIAYTLDQYGFTAHERRLVAEAFATDLHLTGTPRIKFLEECRNASEQERGS
jgi:hypothetical protein